MNPINFFDFGLFLVVIKIIITSQVLRYFLIEDPNRLLRRSMIFQQLNFYCGWQSCVGSSVIIFISPNSLNYALLNTSNKNLTILPAICRGSTLRVGVIWVTLRRYCRLVRMAARCHMTKYIGDSKWY